MRSSYFSWIVFISPSVSLILSSTVLFSLLSSLNSFCSFFLSISRPWFRRSRAWSYSVNSSWDSSFWFNKFSNWFLTTDSFYFSSIWMRSISFISRSLSWFAFFNSLCNLWSFSLYSDLWFSSLYIQSFSMFSISNWCSLIRAWRATYISLTALFNCVISCICCLFWLSSSSFKCDFCLRISWSFCVWWFSRSFFWELSICRFSAWSALRVNWVCSSRIYWRYLSISNCFYWKESANYS